jgi:F-box protein 11
MSKPLRRSRRLQQGRNAYDIDEDHDAKEPARKKPSPEKKLRISRPVVALQQGVSNLEDLPDELLLCICTYCHERDLCHLARVSKRLNRISSDETLWKQLFNAVFELPAAFEIEQQSPKGCMSLPSSPSGSDSIGRAFNSPISSPTVSWKAHFRIMHGSYHVSAVMADRHRKTECQLPRKYFERLSDALAHCSVPSPLGDITDRRMIVVHSGSYYEQLVIDRPVIIIGAGKVILASSSGRVVQFKPQAKNSVLANLTIKGGAPMDSTDLPPYYCVDIPSNCWPVIQGCSISSSADGGACLHIHGSGSCPTVKDCQVCDSESVGIYVDDEATGLYCNNDIFNNKLAGVWIRNLAAPIFRKNRVHHGRDVGFFVFDCGQGLLEGNIVSENRIAGVEVKNEANPIVLKNNICNGKTGGVYIHDSGRGQFIDNHIFGNQYAGVWITSDSNPTLKGNKIYGGKQGGVYIFSKGRGLLESNDIYGKQAKQ